VTLYLVRHAHAGTRGRFEGPDIDRPLSDKGHRQAEALAAQLRDAAVDRVLSSRAVRCQETVEPVARQRGLEVEVHPALTEGTSAPATTTLLWQLAADGVDAVLSSHGDVIPVALAALHIDGVAVDDHWALPKATYYVLDVDGGLITEARFVDPRP
jgi:broad specificity phosphatase PhoE